MTSFDWKTAYLKGDISFADALHFYLQESGAPAFLLQKYEQALDEYQNGEVSDLAVPLGIAMAKREKNSMENATWVSHVRFHVDSYSEQGYPKNDPTKFDDTAFHEASKLLGASKCNRGTSPSQLFDIYYSRKREK